MSFRVSMKQSLISDNREQFYMVKLDEEYGAKGK